MPDQPKPSKKDMDEPIKIDLNPETALRSIMETGPHRDDEPVDEDTELRHDAE